MRETVTAFKYVKMGGSFVFDSGLTSTTYIRISARKYIEVGTGRIHRVGTINVHVRAHDSAIQY